MTKADPGIVTHTVRELKGPLAKVIKDNNESGGVEEFNRRLVASGLKPDHIKALTPLSIQFGLWMGECFRDGLPLNVAIAELEDVVASPIETLLAECKDDIERVRMIMLKAAMNGLALCCEEGRVIEAATFIITCSSEALTDTLTS